MVPCLVFTQLEDYILVLSLGDLYMRLGALRNYDVAIRCGGKLSLVFGVIC